MTLSLYTDGGVIGPNPSKLGGTWAWILVEKGGNIIRFASGIVTPEEIGLPTVSNNLTELLAAVRGISRMPIRHCCVHTDSQVTLRRITTGKMFAGVPDWLKQQTIRLRRECRYGVVLVAGHPTKKELRIGNRNGRPVSKWNVWCDKECTRLAKKFLQEREEL